MARVIQPWQILLAAPAGWINQQQQEQLRGTRLRLTDDQRRRLAEIATSETPDTILAWHRKLIAVKWTYAR